MKNNLKDQTLLFPNDPGIYKFFNDEEILYIGKAKNLKKRINLDVLILIVLLFVLNPQSYKYLWDNDGALSNEKVLLLTFNTTLIIFFLAIELISVLIKFPFLTATESIN